MGRAPAITALKDLRFGLKSREFVCVLGPSGCGKTTLLNIIAGLDRRFDGRVSLSPATGRNTPVIGYVFQQPRLLPWRTVEENISLVLTSEQSRSGMVDELIEAMGLLEFRHAYPERLSVGMTRRVALARAFAVQPDLLLMDEPFVSLDEPTAERLRMLLLDIWQSRPTTVLFVTHDTREATRLPDRVIVLTPSPGTLQSIVAIDTPRARRGDPECIDAMRHRIRGS
jgi:NitT/TauT family transport system ATP-binding protein